MHHDAAHKPFDSRFWFSRRTGGSELLARIGNVHYDRDLCARPVRIMSARKANRNRACAWGFRKNLSYPAQASQSSVKTPAETPKLPAVLSKLPAKSVKLPADPTKLAAGKPKNPALGLMNQNPMTKPTMLIILQYTIMRSDEQEDPNAHLPKASIPGGEIPVVSGESNLPGIANNVCQIPGSVL